MIFAINEYKEVALNDCMPLWLSWLERALSKREVLGSTPNGG